MSLSTGKRIRMGHIRNPRSGRLFLLAMDHGFSEGPLAGLEDPAARLREIGPESIDAVVVHRGMVERIEPHCSAVRRLGLVVHLSGSTRLSDDPNHKALVCSVDGAVRLGADAVSVHVNLGSPKEREMLSDLGRVAEACHAYGVPLLAMMYPRGPNVRDPYDARIIAHVIRVASELGADIVKTSYTGDASSFARALANAAVPVVVAGGPKAESDRALLQMVFDALDAGASGVCFGRNVFQHRAPDRIAEAIENVVHRRLGVGDAVDLLEQPQRSAELRPERSLA